MSGVRGLPPESLLQASIVIDNIRIHHDCGHFQGEVFRDLAKRAADALAHSAKVEKTQRDYSTEYRLQVYVISPDDLHRLIQEEAARLVRYMPVSISLVGEVKP